MASWTANYGPYVQLKVTATETNVSAASNASRVRVQSSIYYPGGTSSYNGYPQTLTVSVNGTQIGRQTGITYSLSTSSRTKTLNTYNSNNITHNADGSKSVNVKVHITDNKGDTATISQTLTLTTIARASTLTAFSFGGALNTSTANTIKYTVGRASSSFRHQIQLRDGSTTVMSWDNVSSNGASTINLTASQVNTLLRRMSSVTSKSFTLRVATRSGVGGGWIGGAVSRNATATVHSSVTPSVSALSVSQTGNTVSSHYLQGKSRVTASFTRTAGYGASISSSSITVRRKTSNNDVQTISGPSGTTSKVVALTGTYEARGVTKDSRGRTTYTAWKEFAVTEYSPPRITSFTAIRSSSTPTTVSVYRVATHTSLGGANSARMLIQKKGETAAWTTVQDSSDAGGSWSASVNSTGNSVTRSYEFRATLTDAFGEVASATVTVSTETVVLDIHKDEGVGIGKIHEKGALDVGGDAYFNGYVSFKGGIRSQRLPRGTDLNSITKAGFYYNSLNNDVGTMFNVPDANAFALLVEDTAGTRQTWAKYGVSVKDEWVRQQYGNSWGAWIKVH